MYNLSCAIVPDKVWRPGDDMLKFREIHCAVFINVWLFQNLQNPSENQTTECRLVHLSNSDLQLWDCRWPQGYQGFGSQGKILNSCLFQPVSLNLTKHCFSVKIHISQVLSPSLLGISRIHLQFHDIHQMPPVFCTHAVRVKGVLNNSSGAAGWIYCRCLGGGQLCSPWLANLCSIKEEFWTD